MSEAGRVSSPRRGRRILGWGVAVLALVLVLPIAVLAWLLGSESGLRTLVGAAERFGGEAVVIERARGRVLGELDIARVEVSLPAMRLEVVDFSLAWHPRELFSGTLDVTHLRVDAIEYSAAPSDDSEPSTFEPPSSVVLPLDVRVREVALGRLSLMPWQEEGGASDAPPEPLFELRDLDSAISSDGRVHRIEHLSLITPFAELALDATLDAGQLPFQLALDGRLKGEHDGYGFGLGYRIRGDLDELHISLAGDGAGVDGEAEVVVRPFETVPLRSLSAAIGVIDPAEFVAGAPSAALRLNAELSAANGEVWRLEGPIHVENAQPGSLDSNALPFSRLSARIDWSPELTRVSDLDLQLLGDGHLRGDAEWQPGAEEDGFGRVSALLELAGIRTELLDTRLPPAELAGKLDAQGDAERQSATLELDVGEATLRAEGYFEPSVEEGGAGRFAAQGELRRFNPAALLAESPPADLNLDFESEGELAETPRIAAQWTFSPSRFDGRPLAGHGRLTLVGERVEDADVELVLAGNTVRANGAWGRIDDLLAVRIDAPALEALGFGLAGRARAEASVSGTRTEPSGELTLFAEGLQVPGEVRIGGLNASGRLERGLDGPLSFALGVSTIGATGGETWIEQASLAIDGTREQHAIELEAATPDQDHLALRLVGALLEGRTGGGDGVRWRGELATLESSGRVALSLQNAAPLRVAADRVRLEGLRLDAGENGRIELQETEWTPSRIVARGSLTGLQVVERRGRGRAAEGLTLGANWDVRLTDTANGELHVFREGGDFWIPGELPTAIGLEQLDLRADIRDNRLDARLDARGTELGEVEGRLAARLERAGETWRLAPDGALDGELRLDMPSVAWLSRLIEEETVLGGSVRAAVTLAGTPSSPDARGQLEGSGLSVMLVEYGVELAGGELLAEFDQDRMRLSRFEFVSPNRVRPRDSRVPVERFTETPGSLRATGEVALDTGDGAFDFTADRMPILQRRDRWLLLSGEGRAVSTWTSLDLDAAFRTDAGYFEMPDTPPPSLSDDVVVVSGEPEPEAARDDGMAVSADIRVSLGEQLYLSALGLDTRLSGDLRLLMRPGEGLTATGSLATVGGVFRGYGQNLTIQRGIINFQGPLDNPGLNVRAVRTGLPVEAGIEVVGSARRPVIRLVSQPDVPDPEKLSWIVLGRAPSAGGGADLGLLLPAAQALLGGSEGGGMTDQLSRSLGFDEFGIGQGELGSVSRRQTSQVVGGGTVSEDATVSGQVLTLGRRLSSDLFLSFEQSLGGAESLVKLSYQLSRRVSVVARGGTDNSADIYYTVSFR